MKAIGVEEMLPARARSTDRSEDLVPRCSLTRQGALLELLMGLVVPRLRPKLSMILPLRRGRHSRSRAAAMSRASASFISMKLWMIALRSSIREGASGNPSAHESIRTRQEGRTVDPSREREFLAARMPMIGDLDLLVGVAVGCFCSSTGRAGSIAANANWVGRDQLGSLSRNPDDLRKSSYHGVRASSCSS